ncbi:FAD-dependent monooxygenase [Streptosporangium subroseum]|uniref:FAD-dependent monooxygenase n=1 Tax=Streptosporangium subroseum TaxID=106412 RepID=UPI0030928D30|nr:FAD-dependent monooxygenase [Streptosporangium subroseum]
MMTPDVVIVGGGPNGLLMACELALAGVRPVVLELLPERNAAPKANGLVGRVVQVLDYRGLYERFSRSTEPPTPVPYFQFGALFLDMSAWDGNSLYALPIPQYRMEELLEQRAHELGVEIRRGHEVTALSQDAEGVTVDVRGPDGSYRLSTGFLVGADGGHSAIRKQAGIGFPGITDRSFVGLSGQVTIHPPVAVPGTGELEVPGLGRLWPGTFTRTENGVFSFGMFQPGVYRVAVFEWDRPPVEDRAFTPVEDLREAVNRVLGADVPMSDSADGQGPPPVRNTDGINSRLADRYRQGRVFLIGDAAHVQSGVGGPGLNLGMQDVINLAWKLAADVNGWAPEGLLDTYESERRPAAERVIMSSRAQTALLSPGPNITALREVFTELLGDQANVRRISNLMSGVDVRHDMRSDGPAHPITGGWMPDLALSTKNGPTRVADLMHAARPILLDLADRADLVEAASDWADRVDVVTATCEDRPADAVLIRPDGYVAWAAASGTSGGADALRQALRTWFGLPVQATSLTGADLH